MNLRETMLADARAVLNDLPGEEALYLPADGQPRLIRVAVDREPTQTNAEPRGRLEPVIVWAMNSTTGGISGEEVTTQDRVRLAKVKGGEQIEMRVVNLRDENPGWIELELL
jgi:hypothetical protein